MRGFRFRVFKVTPREKAKSEVFLAASPLVSSAEDNKARPRSFFAARVFGRTTREKLLVPRVIDDSLDFSKQSVSSALRLAKESGY